MKFFLRTLLLAVAIAFVAPTCQAQLLVFEANLNGLNEAPPNASPLCVWK